MNWNKLNHPILRDEQGGEGDTGGDNGGSEAQSSSPSAKAIFGSDPDQLKTGHNHRLPGVEPDAPEGEDGAEGGDEGGEDGEAAPAAKSAAITPELLKTLMTEAAIAARGPQQQQAAPQQQQELTEQQIEQMFKFPKLDANRFKSVFGLEPESPEQLNAFNGILKEAMYAAARMAAYHATGQIQAVEQRYQPLAQTVQQTRAKAEWDGFFAKNKDLKAHADLVKMVKAQAKTDGLSFNTVEEAEAYLAKTTRAVLTRVRGGAANNGQGSARPGQPKMTTTNVGGQSSHGRGGTGNGPRSNLQKSVAIFQTGR